MHYKVVRQIRFDYYVSPGELIWPLLVVILRQNNLIPTINYSYFILVLITTFRTSAFISLWGLA